MKQYTNESQTAKLIELGFEKPCSIASVEPIYGMGGISVAKAYTIGELIDMLPPIIDEYSSAVIGGGGAWSVHYERIFESRYDAFAKELIDALYNMVVKLKKEGVI